MDLFERSDTLNTPIECFWYDAAQEVFPVRPHWHYFVEIIYMVEGVARIGVDDVNYLLEEGDMIVFHPKVRHSVYRANQMFPKYMVIKFDIGNFNMNSSYAPKLRNLFRYAQTCHMDIFFPKEVADYMGCQEKFDICLKETQNSLYGYDMIVKNRIYELLICVIRHWLDSGMSIASNVYGDDDDVDIENITEYIAETLHEGLRVQDLAEKCDMSYSNFAKRFKEIYGIACKEYVERLRVYKVEEYLLFTEFDLTYISQETGFADCSHMIKSYKKLRGITPGQVRIKRRTE